MVTSGAYANPIRSKTKQKAIGRPGLLSGRSPEVGGDADPRQMTIHDRTRLTAPPTHGLKKSPCPLKGRDSFSLKHRHGLKSLTALYEGNKAFHSNIVLHIKPNSDIESHAYCNWFTACDRRETLREAVLR